MPTNKARLLVAVMIACLAAGCDVPPDLSVGPASGRTRTAARTANSITARSTGRIRIASFNLQVFGVEKLRNPATVKALVDIFSRFDVLALQEIRSVDQSVFRQLIMQVNAT